MSQLLAEMEDAAIELQLYASPATSALANKLKSATWEAVRMSEQVMSKFEEIKELRGETVNGSADSPVDGVLDEVDGLLDEVNGVLDRARRQTSLVEQERLLDEMLTTVHHFMMSEASEYEAAYLSATRKDLDVDAGR